jgi:MFS superfamily sulfate permease-like transporter
MKTVLVILICMLIVAIEIGVIVAMFAPHVLLRPLRAMRPAPRARKAAPRAHKAQDAH